jgi:hypothetical protein
VDGPQFENHNAWLATLKLDILPNPGETDSFSSTNINGRNFLQMSVIFAVSSQGQSTQKSEVLLPYSSNSTSYVW